MNSPSQPDNRLNRIEQRLTETEALIQRQSIMLNRLRERLIHTSHSDEWCSVQFSELFRIMARDVRELRTTLIWSVVSDQPISAELLQVLLWATVMGDEESEPPRGSPFCSN